MPHKIFTSAIEHINFSSENTTIPLATATHSFFHALSPVFVDSLFLTPKQIEFFCDRCPIYQYATSILLCAEEPLKTETENETENENEPNEAEQHQQEQPTKPIDAEFFARIAAPLRFLKTVRFHSSLFKLIRADLGDELVKLNFLEDAYLFQISIVKITVSEFYDLSEEENIADKLQDDQFLVLRSLVFDHAEEAVKASAATFTYDVLWEISGDFAPVQSLLLRGANNNQDNNNPSSFPLLEKLFSLLKHPVKSEDSWGTYINFLAVLVDGRDDVLFEEHISPHLDVLFHLLDLRSIDILYSIGYFFNGLIADRTENDPQKQQQMFFPLFECGLIPDLLEAESQSLARIREQGGRVSSAVINIIAVYSSVEKFRLQLLNKSESVLELLKDRFAVNKKNDDEVRMNVCQALIYFFQVRADKERGVEEVKLTPELFSLILDNALDVQTVKVQCRAMDCLMVSLNNFSERTVHWELERFHLISQFKERFVLNCAMYFFTRDQITRPSTDENDDDDEDDENDDDNDFGESLQDARDVRRILLRIFGSHDSTRNNKLPPTLAWPPNESWRLRSLLRALMGLAKWELIISRLLLTKARVIEMLRRADEPPSFGRDFSARLSHFTSTETQGSNERDRVRTRLTAFNSVLTTRNEYTYFRGMSSTLEQAKNMTMPESSTTIDAFKEELNALHDALHTFHKKVYKTVTAMPLKSVPKSLLFQQQDEDRRVYSDSEWNSLLSKMFEVPSHTASGAQQPKSEDDIDRFAQLFFSFKTRKELDLFPIRHDTASSNLLKSCMKWNSETRRPLFYTALETLYNLRLEGDGRLPIESENIRCDGCAAIGRCHEFYRLADDAKKMFMYRSGRRSSKK